MAKKKPVKSRTSKKVKKEVKKSVPAASKAEPATASSSSDTHKKGGHDPASKSVFSVTPAKKRHVSLIGLFRDKFFAGRADAHSRKVFLKSHMDKAGLRSTTASVQRWLLAVCIILNLIITVYAINKYYSAVSSSILFLIVLVVFIWTLIFATVLFVCWFFLYIGLDLAIYQRRMKLEEVLPDFLQLASSNIRAGMTIDQALWFAVRPRFGVLAMEIEEVAKRTYAGEPLEVALKHLVNKYDSRTLERSMNLLVEGLRAGGEMGDLLNKIAENINEVTIMKKELAANVTTYVIFITFATIFAAPFLFGMAFQLIIVIQEVFSKVDISPGAASGFPIMISKGVISISDFQTFAAVSLIITSFFSAIIISAIKKGNVKAGVRYIPMFIISSLTLFFFVIKMFSLFTEGFF